MSNSDLAQLAALGGPALGESCVHPVSLGGWADPASLEQLDRLLRIKNGFYAFERSLHVFPSGAAGRQTSIELWNSDPLWRAEYGELANGLLFFAEDLFGDQFCLAGGRVFRFHSETAEVRLLADDVVKWASYIIAAPDSEVGFAFARRWQQLHGTLQESKRLFAKYPFVLGGDVALSNLRAFDSVAGMRFLGHLAQQLHNLPDGAQVQIEIVD